MAHLWETVEDTSFAIHESVAEGETVAVRFTIAGRHLRDYRGHLGKNQDVLLNLFAFFHFRGDKIASGHVIGDWHVVGAE